eukprot:365319-Chlamydomonas_euryale.AAC.20
MTTDRQTQRAREREATRAPPWQRAAQIDPRVRLRARARATRPRGEVRCRGRRAAQYPPGHGIALWRAAEAKRDARAPGDVAAPSRLPPAQAQSCRRLQDPRSLQAPIDDAKHTPTHTLSLNSLNFMSVCSGADPYGPAKYVDVDRDDHHRAGGFPESELLTCHLHSSILPGR